MKFSIIHPSKGRPRMALDTAMNWVGKASGQNEVEYILSLDHEDPTAKTYAELFNGLGVTIVTASNRSMIDACNSGAKLASGHCLVLVSDDFDCPYNWDVMLAMYAASCETMDYLIVPDDGYSTDLRLATIPIMSFHLYKRLGYIYNPVYFSMWADNDLYETCDKLGVLVRCPAKFQHNHWTNGKRKQDNTDRGHSSQSAFDNGKRIFEKRSREGFPV